MPTKPRRRRPAPSAYSKISATLETVVLREIRERTANVSEFLNDAATRQLYRERIREGIEELKSQGVESDVVFKERFREALLGPMGRRRKRA